ncbi:HK97 family phage prohead protease [Pelagibacterium halotolerans]|uniref:HK97 family phage prohead protease n=1 Tax=Pelagibacterium halotolerans TaxID=531813 RepID=UPI00385109C3
MDRLFIETKILAEDDGSITGMAWPFKSADRVGDMIEKGAFAGTSLPLPMLFGHDGNDPVGAWSEAKETDEGLELKGALLIKDVVRAREVNALVKAGAVRGISIGFITRKATKRAGGGRTIKELELIEASLVAIPMHPGARVTSAKSGIQAIRIAEAINRATAQFAKR